MVAPTGRTTTERTTVTRQVQAMLAMTLESDIRRGRHVIPLLDPHGRLASFYSIELRENAG